MRKKTQDRLTKIEERLAKKAERTKESDIVIPRLEGEPDDVREWGEVIESGNYAIVRKAKFTEQKPDRRITQERAVALAKEASRKYPGETFLVVETIAEYKIAVDERFVHG